MSTEKKYYRAILVLNGTTEDEYQLALQQALDDISEKFNPESPNFSGDFEMKQYNKAVEEWEKTGSVVKRYHATADDLSNIDFMVNMAAVPVNFMTGDSKVMVLGPELSEELDVHVSTLKEIM